MKTQMLRLTTRDRLQNVLCLSPPMSPAVKTSDATVAMQAVQLSAVLGSIISHSCHHLRNPLVILNSEADYVNAVIMDDIPQMQRMEERITDEECSIHQEELKNVVDRTEQEAREYTVDMSSEEISSVAKISQIADE